MRFFRWFIVREHISAWLFTPGVGSINHKANTASRFDGFSPHTPTDELAFDGIGKMQISLPQSDSVKLQIVAALFYWRFGKLFEIIFLSSDFRRSCYSSCSLLLLHLKNLNVLMLRQYLPRNFLKHKYFICLPALAANWNAFLIG